MHPIKKVANQLPSQLAGRDKYIQEGWQEAHIADPLMGNCEIQQDCTQCPTANQCPIDKVQGATIHNGTALL